MCLQLERDKMRVGVTKGQRRTTPWIDKLNSLRAEDVCGFGANAVVIIDGRLLHGGPVKEFYNHGLLAVPGGLAGHLVRLTL